MKRLLVKLAWMLLLIVLLTLLWRDELDFVYRTF